MDSSQNLCIQTFDESVAKEILLLRAFLVSKKEGANGNKSEIKSVRQVFDRGFSRHRVDGFCYESEKRFDRLAKNRCTSGYREFICGPVDFDGLATGVRHERKVVDADGEALGEFSRSIACQ